MRSTHRLYLDHGEVAECFATVVAVDGDACACDRSCFYPGGGGQPCDLGTLAGERQGARAVVAVHADERGVVWHRCEPPADMALVGQRVTLGIDVRRRRALARYHTVLHVLNTIALRDHDGWITGVQIGTEGSRIDFRIDDFGAPLCAELERKVNAVLQCAYPIRAYYLDQEAYRQRDDLRRTLDVAPPVVDGRVRVVEIEGFDAQACGGTHVASTAEVGRFTIDRRENKGRRNKRMYVRLE